MNIGSTRQPPGPAFLSLTFFKGSGDKEQSEETGEMMTEKVARAGQRLKRDIEDALKHIIGQPLTDMWRYAGFQRFEFGVQRPGRNRKGQAITVAGWSLTVGCRWRITGPNGYVVSSDDFGPGNNRRDEGARPFYQMLKDDPPIVETLTAGERGGIRIKMSRGYMLEVIPDEEPQDDLGATDYEQWLFIPRDQRRKRFTFTAQGLEAWSSRSS